MLNIKLNQYYKQDELILILRGHIRKSFDNNELYNFIKILSNNYKLKIYLHTWNTKSNNLSWREIEEDNTNINEDTIKKYFNDLFKFIKKIYIDNDKENILLGNTKGNLILTKMPRIGWKNMWYGIHKICQEVFNNENDNIIILNTRFDSLNNSNSLHSEYLLTELKKYFYLFLFNKFEKNYFIKIPNSNINGIDNNIVSDKNKLIILTKHFHENLDEIEKKYMNLKGYAHETMVFFENETLFTPI